MLGKLIKYEFKSTSRIMWFLYIALVVVGGLLGLTLRVDSDGLGMNLLPFLVESDGGNKLMATILAILGGIYVLMIQAIFIMTIIMIITRFNKNLLGGEGYLMHTLPVNTHNLILSKGIVAIIWGIIAAVAGVLSGILFSITSGVLGLIIRENAWHMIWYSIKEMMTFNVFLGTVAVIIGCITGVLAFYFAMAIGNMANKNKFLFAVIAYIVIQVIFSTIFSIIGVNGGGTLGILLYDNNMRQFLIINIVEQLIMGVIFFFGTNYILKNKLNLA